jgi:hypothetical protein
MAVQQAVTSLPIICNCGVSTSPQDTLEMIAEGDGRTPKLFSMGGGGPTLATLPMDVLFMIFKCFDDYDSPRFLAQSCRSLRQAYYTNQRSISLQCLPHHPRLQGDTTSFYESAMELYRQQQEYAGIGK